MGLHAGGAPRSIFFEADLRISVSASHVGELPPINDVLTFVVTPLAASVLKIRANNAGRRDDSFRRGERFEHSRTARQKVLQAIVVI
jgi:hypothetical protein